MLHPLGLSVYPENPSYWRCRLHAQFFASGYQFLKKELLYSLLKLVIQFFLFSHFLSIIWTLEFSLIPCVLIHFSHSCCYSIKLLPLWPVDTPSRCISFNTMHLLLKAALLSGITRYSRLTLYLSLPHIWNLPFLQGPTTVSFQWIIVWEPESGC